MAQILRLLFPTAPSHLQEAIDDLEGEFLEAFRETVPRAVSALSVARGSAVGSVVFHWSRWDGGHEGYLHNFPGYTAPRGPGLWEPTPPGYLRALQPHWGANRYFAISPGDDCAPGRGPDFSTDNGTPFVEEAREVYECVNRADPEQIAIARFWSDDPGATSTPPGHSVSILTQMLRAKRATLDTAVEAYARVGMAVADAFIACWRVKYRVNLLRPITFIRRVIDPEWGDPTGAHPLPLVTPPFPEYTSGHSVQCSATATVLGFLFGEQAFVDHSNDSRGMAPRHFASFAAAAQEAAMSRLYGGIHFRSAIENGLKQGQYIGTAINSMTLRA